MIPNNSIDTQSPCWFSGTTKLDPVQGSSIVLGLNINKGSAILQHYIGLDWNGCTRYLKETARFASIFQTVMELGTTLSITSSTSAILLQTTRWPSVDMSETQRAKSWCITMASHSQRTCTTPITTGCRGSTAQLTMAEDSGVKLATLLDLPCLWVPVVILSPPAPVLLI